MTDPTRVQLADAIAGWQRQAQQLLDAVNTEQAAWLALSNTPTSMWLAAHHSWQVAAAAAEQTLCDVTGSTEWGWLDASAADYLQRRVGLDEYGVYRLIDRYELDRRPIDVLEGQLRDALGSLFGSDYLHRLADRATLARRTLTASALLAS